jgi:hypothetical protein
MQDYRQDLDEMRLRREEMERVEQSVRSLVGLESH